MSVEWFSVIVAKCDDVDEAQVNLVKARKDSAKENFKNGRSAEK